MLFSSTFVWFRSSLRFVFFFVQACLNNNGPVPSVLLAHLGLPLVQFHFVFLRCHGGCEAVRSGSGCGGGGVGFGGAVGAGGVVGIGGAVCGGVSPNRWNAAVLVRTCYRCPAVVAPPPSSLMTDSVLLLISALYCLPLSLVGWAESGTVPVIRSCRS